MWDKFLSLVGLENNPLLDEFERFNKIKLLGAFSQEMQEAWFSPDNFTSLAENTIWTAMNNMSE